jgi:hypothetical protein
MGSGEMKTLKEQIKVRVVEMANKAEENHRPFSLSEEQIRELYIDATQALIMPEVDRLIAALEFYANKDNHTIRAATDALVPMKKDLGKLAANALAQWSKFKGSAK